MKKASVSEMMRWLMLQGVLSVVALGTQVLAQEAPKPGGGPPWGEIPSDLELQSGLEKLLTAESPAEYAESTEGVEAERIIEYCALSGDVQWIPTLEKITEVYQQVNHGRILLLAFHGLAELGVEPDYFLNIALSEHSKADSHWRVYYSLHMYAYQPTAQGYETLLGTFYAKEDQEWLNRVYEVGRMVTWIDQSGKDSSSIETKAQQLTVRGMLVTGKRYVGLDLTTTLSPRAVWSRRQLRLLSKENPVEVANVLMKMESPEISLASSDLPVEDCLDRTERMRWAFRYLVDEECCAKMDTIAKWGN